MSKKPQRPPGRPPKTTPKANETVTVKATLAEKKRWQQVAGDGKLSGWIRDLCNAACKAITEK
jgi:hypothetical protein